MSPVLDDPRALDVLEALPDGVLVVRDGRTAYANAALRALLPPAERAPGAPAPSWLAPARATGGWIDLPGERPAWVTSTPLADGDRLVVVRLAPAETQELVRLAHHDPLTGLLNRRAFTARLEDAVRRRRAEGRPFALVLFDLDRFKAVNDQHGHPTGDRVLAEAARRLGEVARGVDATGRIGGEEFAWLLPDAGPQEGRRAAHRLAEALRSAPFGPGLRVTASFGLHAPGPADDAAATLARADAALYWSKAAGRDTVLAWSAEVAARVAHATAGDASAATLAAQADAVDPGPDRGHGRRVADLCVAIADVLDWPPHRQAQLHRAALLHDLGKAALDAELLSRPAALRPHEVRHLRQHPAIGAWLARDVLTPEQASWVRHHHERWDGRGYPGKLAGAAIPDGAQVLALADAWDTMRSDRPYRRALSPERAMAEVEREAGGQFLPGAGELLRAARAWWAEAPAAPAAA